MMFWYGNGIGGWGYVLMTVSMVLFWGLVIFGVVTMVRYLGRAPQRAQTGSARSQPEDVLADRFARGEIDEHEYQRRLEILHNGPRSAAEL
ncbi:MAG: SHOCT domain-containing protein [Pseudonocardiales bacterium]|nr:SHOCT domain-containing protein [Pseudonocardiales bacterium]